MKKRISGWLRSGVIMFLIIVIQVSLVFGEDSAIVEKRTAAIKEAGYPTTFLELKDYCRIPEGTENAADIYSKAFAAYSEPGKNYPISLDDFMGQRYERLEIKTVKAIERYLKSNRRTLSLLRQAGRIKYCQYSLDYESIPWNENLMDLKNCLTLLKVQAIHCAKRDKPTQSLESINGLINLADSLRNEPLLVSPVVRIACLYTALSCLESTFSHTELSDLQLVSLQQRLSENIGEERLVTSMAGEQCFFLEGVKNPDKFVVEGSEFEDLLKDKAVIMFNFSSYLDFLQDYWKTSKLGGRGRFLKYKELEKKREALDDRYVLIKSTMISMHVVHLIDLDVNTRMQCGQIALGIERYRLERKKLPDRLGELVGEYLESVPEDPYTGRELVYKKTNPGYVIYSLGEDGMDQGGLAKGKRVDSKGPYDLTFTVTR